MKSPINIVSCMLRVAKWNIIRQYGGGFHVDMLTLMLLSPNILPNIDYDLMKKIFHL